MAMMIKFNLLPDYDRYLMNVVNKIIIINYIKCILISTHSAINRNATAQKMKLAEVEEVIL